MATPKELRANISEARAGFIEALHDVHGRWDTKPQGTADGEAAWSPHEVAHHVAQAEWYFTNAICVACGAPEVARPAVEDSTPGKVAGTITRNSAKFDDLLRHVSDADLAKEIPIEGPLKGATVERALTIWPAHLKDHAAQMRAGA